MADSGGNWQQLTSQVPDVLCVRAALIAGYHIVPPGRALFVNCPVVPGHSRATA